jgi:hypothetical protein
VLITRGSLVRAQPDPPDARWEEEVEKRGFSSAGRAPALQAGGRRFDPVNLHQFYGDRHGVDIKQVRDVKPKSLRACFEVKKHCLQCLRFDLLGIKKAVLFFNN